MERSVDLKLNEFLTRQRLTTEVFATKAGTADEQFPALPAFHHLKVFTDNRQIHSGSGFADGRIVRIWRVPGFPDGLINGRFGRAIRVEKSSAARFPFGDDASGEFLCSGHDHSEIWQVLSRQDLQDGRREQCDGYLLFTQQFSQRRPRHHLIPCADD